LRWDARIMRREEETRDEAIGALGSIEIEGLRIGASVEVLFFFLDPERRRLLPLKSVHAALSRSFSARRARTSSFNRRLPTPVRPLEQHKLPRPLRFGKFQHRLIEGPDLVQLHAGDAHARVLPQPTSPWRENVCIVQAPPPQRPGFCAQWRRGRLGGEGSCCQISARAKGARRGNLPGGICGGLEVFSQICRGRFGRNLHGKPSLPGTPGEKPAWEAEPAEGTFAAKSGVGKVEQEQRRRPEPSGKFP